MWGQMTPYWTMWLRHCCCCKIRENRRALLRLGALDLLLETVRCAFKVDAMEPAEGILLIVESLTLEANESDNISITQSGLTISTEEIGAGDQAKKIVLIFLERLSNTSKVKKSSKQQRNTEMVARILPYLTYGEPSAMEALVQHFDPYLQNWAEFDSLQMKHEENPKDESIAQRAVNQKFAVENFVRVSESLNTSSCGERLKDIILERGITRVAIRHLSGFLGEKILELRHATKDEMRRLALKRREELLQVCCCSLISDAP